MSNHNPWTVNLAGLYQILCSLIFLVNFYSTDDIRCFCGFMSIFTCNIFARHLRLMLLCMLQEVVFYEDGEPIVDGEPGDLKVSLIESSYC